MATSIWEVFVAAFLLTAAPPQPVEPTTVALVETWPDGGTNYELTTTQRGVFWTPRFRRIEGYKLPDGAQPVRAVQFARILVGHDIHVEVSVLLASAEPDVPVARVVIQPGTHVVINELTRFGVQPVTLSMAEVAPMTPYLPTVSSVSPQIEFVGVEVTNTPFPRYRVTLRNLSARGVSNVHVQTYRGQNKALSVLKRNDDGRPMMRPGGAYTFDINLTSGTASPSTKSGTWSPVPLDLIELDSIRWEDATGDGVSPFPQIEAAVEADSGKRLQLFRVIDALNRVLRESSLYLFVTARQRIEHLPDAEPDQVDAAQLGMLAVKTTVRGDLARFTSGSDNEARDWLTLLVKRYEAWLGRLSPP